MRHRSIVAATKIVAAARATKCAAQRLPGPSGHDNPFDILSEKFTDPAASPGGSLPTR
jgi:hypothetical protein